MRKLTRNQTNDIVAFIIKVAIGLVFLFPIFICISYGLRPDTELMNRSKSLLPETWTLEHFRWVFRYVPVFRYMMNSFICCAIVIFFQLLLGTFAAYGFSYFNFKGKKILFDMVMLTMMIPGDVTIITNFMTIQKLGLKNTYVGFTIPFLVGCTGILLLRQFYMSMPTELKEASTIDGCGDMGFLFRIAVPLSVPSLISFAIYEFIIIYNQYFWPLLVSTTEDMHTIQIGMSMLVGHESDEVGRVLAGAIICIIPSTVVFIIGQKQLVQGMVAGSVKG